MIRTFFTFALLLFATPALGQARAIPDNSLTPGATRTNLDALCHPLQQTDASFIAAIYLVAAFLALR